MNLIAFVLITPLLFGLLIWLIATYWQRIIERSITRHFRAAESITEQNQIPASWIQEIQRKTESGRFRFLQMRTRTPTDLLIGKLDETMRFFKKSSFYANDEAKEVLLTSLETVRKRWAQMEWDELLNEQNETIQQKQ